MIQSNRLVLSLLALFAFAPAATAAPKKGATAPATGAPKAAPKEIAKPAAEPPHAAAPAPVTAVAPANFEELLKDGVPSRDLSRDLEPLFATCAKDSDLAYRQCETIRQWHVERIKGARYVASADGAALQAAPWDATEKSFTLTVNGCLDCQNPIQLGGGPLLLATKAPRGFADGLPIGVELSDHEVGAADAKKAKKFSEKTLPRLRVEMVFTVGEPFEMGKGDAATKGLAIVALGHRVYDRCSGEVVASSPVSLKAKEIPAAERDPSCPAADAPTEEEVAEAAEQAQLPETLSRADIERAMAPVQQRVIECATEFELNGVARVSLSVSGDGQMTVKVAAPFDKGEANICIRQALKEAQFPKFKKGKPIPVEYPFVLHP